MAKSSLVAECSTRLMGILSPLELIQVSGKQMVYSPFGYHPKNPLAPTQREEEQLREKIKHQFKLTPNEEIL
jgi:hypothetical protein